MSEKKLHNLLSRPGSRLAGLVRRAREIGTLTDAVRAALPPDVRPHLLSAACQEDGTLVLVTESSAWASRLRFVAGEALAAAREFGVASERCRVLVRPTGDPRTGPPAA